MVEGGGRGGGAMGGIGGRRIEAEAYALHGLELREGTGRVTRRTWMMGLKGNNTGGRGSEGTMARLEEVSGRWRSNLTV